MEDEEDEEEPGVRARAVAWKQQEEERPVGPVDMEEEEGAEEAGVSQREPEVEMEAVPGKIKKRRRKAARNKWHSINGDGPTNGALAAEDMMRVVAVRPSTGPPPPPRQLPCGVTPERPLMLEAAPALMEDGDDAEADGEVYYRLYKRFTAARRCATR
jgi:hypothetical protein